jgi:hypothetical protein
MTRIISEIRVLQGPNQISSDSRKRQMNAPDSVEEQRVAGRFLNTDCGEQWTTMTSSGVNECDGWERTSFSRELVITTLGAPGATAPSGSATCEQ